MALSRLPVAVASTSRRWRTGETRELYRVGTEANETDLHTKQMKDAKTFWRHAESFGMVRLADLLPYQVQKPELKDPRPSTRGRAARAAHAVGGALSWVARRAGPAVVQAVQDPEIRGYVLRWVFRRAGAQ